MRSLQDTIYNWLTIQLVAEDRPDDKSANDTAQFFYEMLENDHGVTDVHVDRREDMYLVTCQTNEGERSYRFPPELIELISEQIKNEPHKYHNYE